MGGWPVNTSLGEVERCFEMSRRACCSTRPRGCRGRRPVPVQGGMRRPGPSSPISRRLLPQVDDLKAKLAIQEAELKQKNENADKLIQVVGVETEKVSKEKAIADEEEIKVEVINKVGRRGLRWAPREVQAEDARSQTSRTPRRREDVSRAQGPQ